MKGVAQSTVGLKPTTLWKAVELAESLKKVSDHSVEIRVFFAEILDLSNGVNHC